MSALFMVLLLLVQAPPTLDQIKADTNLEHRARTAIDFAAANERTAESDYSKGDMNAVSADLKTMAEAVEIAQKALQQTGRTAMRHPGPYKYGELKTQDMLVRLNDLSHRMEPDERTALDPARDKVQEIHDAWFEGIMSKKK